MAQEIDPPVPSAVTISCKFLTDLLPRLRIDRAVREPCLEIVGEIHEIADEILDLRADIHAAFRRPGVPSGRHKVLRAGIGYGRTPGRAPAAKPPTVPIFDERAHWKLPALLRAGAQTGQLSGVHTERARHLQLARVEPADLLRVPPLVFVVRWFLLVT
jgi:hypothetical protein